MLTAINAGLFPKLRHLDITCNRISEKATPAMIKFVENHKGTALTVVMKQQMLHGKKLNTFKQTIREALV